jgi:hypothetical protein
MRSCSLSHTSQANDFIPAAWIEWAAQHVNLSRMDMRLPFLCAVRLLAGLPLWLSLAAAPASAQPLALPGPPVTVPGVQGARVLGDLLAPLEPTLDAVTTPLRDAPWELRHALARTLLAQHRRELEADPAGNPIVRAELLLYDPSPATLAAAEAAGLHVVERRELAGLEAVLVRLAVPQGLSTRRALERLQKAAPGAAADYNHLLQPVGGDEPPNAAGAQSRRAAAGSGPERVPPGPAPAAIGLIDSGVDFAHPALAGHGSSQAGCTSGTLPAAHGTAVASLLAGAAGDFHGAAPGSRLVAVDVYCGRATGGATDQVAAAFASLVQAQVALINVSLVGPRNAVLAAAVAATQARGILVVAAVGNDGPAAAPLYPAALPGVIAVTGVDAQGRLLPEASRSPQLQFAAPGSGLRAADLAGGYALVRGTSYAAPLVAGLLARELQIDSPGAAAQAVDRLAAHIPPEPHRDASRFGRGLVGMQFLDTAPQHPRL